MIPTTNVVYKQREQPIENCNMLKKQAHASSDSVSYMFLILGLAFFY